MVCDDGLDRLHHLRSLLLRELIRIQLGIQVQNAQIFQIDTLFIHGILRGVHCISLFQRGIGRVKVSLTGVHIGHGIVFRNDRRTVTVGAIEILRRRPTAIAVALGFKAAQVGKEALPILLHCARSGAVVRFQERLGFRCGVEAAVIERFGRQVVLQRFKV